MLTTERAFAIKICLGLALGGWFVLWSAYQHPVPQPKRWLDVYLGGILGGIIGARLFYVLLHLERFGREPLTIPRLWYGELAWQGAFLGGGLALWLLCRWREVSLHDFWDSLVLVLPIVLMAVCWAARSAGLILGQTVPDLDQHPVWMASFLPELDRNVAPHYELQMLGVGLGALLLLLGVGLTLTRQLTTSRGWLMVALVGVVIFLLDYLTTGEGKILYGIQVDQVSAAMVWIIGLGLFSLQESVKRMGNSVQPPLIDRL